MSFLATVYSDAGIRKETNQDSALQIEANTDFGHVLLSVICDGMGGLAKGEVASATVIEAFGSWFKKDLPKLLHRKDRERIIFGEWEELIMDCNQKIAAYADARNISMGTTLNAMLFMRGRYYIINVGDSRAYLLSDGLYQLTRDQSLVQREVDMGRMTALDAAVSPRGNILLQCVGASRVVNPEFFFGAPLQNATYLLCSDGFRHKIGNAEIMDFFNATINTDADIMKAHIRQLIELNKQKQEKDNITAALIRTF